MTRRILFLCILAIPMAAPAESSPDLSSCPTSPLIREEAPRDTRADPTGVSDWYVNEDRTIWAGAVPEGGWPAGGTLYADHTVVAGQKTYWVRPRGTQLVITGRRLDASAALVQASIPRGYTTGFQIVALLFPTEGCWEVHAKAGDSELRFVTRVKPATDLKQQ